MNVHTRSIYAVLSQEVPYFPSLHSACHVDLLLAVISSHQQPSQHSMYIVQLVHMIEAIAANEQGACSPADWTTVQGV